MDRFLEYVVMCRMPAPSGSLRVGFPIACLPKVPIHQGVHLDIRLKRGLRELACSRTNDGGFAKPEPYAFMPS